ncbi:MAG: 4Fe-4S binding protein [Muribaculaceae bacterium]|nr:4Fe-4S binding protein [Muribaculaceae bacterium]
MTGTNRCISCGRCIVSCPSAIRQYRDLKYTLTGKVFTAAFSKRKEPEFFA